MATEQPSRPAITSFRGDFDQLAALMDRSWSENREQPLLYTKAFLESAFTYPSSSFDLAPSIYSGEELLAVIAGFSRNVSWNGCDLRLMLTSFLTAAPAVKGAGYGLIVWNDLLRRGRSQGYEGAINYCVEGDDMNRMMLAAAKLFRLNTQRIYSIEFISRFLRPARDFTEAPQDPDIELFLKLAASIPPTVPIRRTWTEEEAVWQCKSREGAMTVSAAHGSRRGMLTGCLISVGSSPPTRAVLLEDLFWGDLDTAERMELLRHFLLNAASRGAQTASCPILNCFSTDPLRAAGFGPSKRLLHAYLTLWNGQEPGPVPSLYIDVL